MRIVVLTVLAALTSCKPPPSDEALTRVMLEDEPVFASDPLPSPDTEFAVWAPSKTAGRIIYGVPQEPALIALECAKDSGEPTIEITRMAPADKGAGALLALVGNGAIGRIAVDAAEIGGRLMWQGSAPVDDRNVEPLKGPRKVTATIPGAGMVELNPSPLPMQIIAQCQNPQSPENAQNPEPTQPAQPDQPAI